MTRTRKALVACGVALLVLTGCSGGGDKASPTTSAPASDATTTIPPVDTSFTGQNSTQFCTLAKTYDERFQNVGGSSTPGQLRAAAQEGRTAINQAVNAAPAEIKADVQVVANVFGALFTELEKASFDVSKVPAPALRPLQAPEFQASSARFQAYLRTVCGMS